MRGFPLCFLGMLTAIGIAVIACGGGEEEELPDVDCTQGPIPTFSQVSAFGGCVVCHDSNKPAEQRQDAPLTVNFDTYEAATMSAEKAAEEVHEGKMPPAGSGLTLTEAQKQDLYKWALCNTPNDPATTDGGGGGSGGSTSAPDAGDGG